MNSLAKILNLGLSRADITFFLRALVTRPGDIPGILRREAARRRANLQANRGSDADGLRLLTDSWQAALAAGMFTAPAGAGPVLRPTADMPLTALVSAMQTARAVHWGAADHPAFTALSLEAARLTLDQHADDPTAAMARRSGYIANAGLPAPLTAALHDLASQAIQP